MAKVNYYPIAFIMILTSVLIFSCSIGGRVETTPMKSKKITVQDGEFLKYGVYINGDRVRGFNMVTRFYPDKKIAVIYIHGTSSNPNSYLPQNYTNYGYQMRIDLENSSLIRADWDFYTNLVLENRNGRFEFHLIIDRQNNEAVYTEKHKNGMEIRTEEIRIKIRKGYPTWSMDSSALGAARFLDMKESGIIYVVIPETKTPIPGKFIYEGKEVLETKAGKFNTLKVTFFIADAFLARLMDSYMKDMHFWIEDSDPGRIIKAQTPWDTSILESISVWKDK